MFHLRYYLNENDEHYRNDLEHGLLCSNVCLSQFSSLCIVHQQNLKHRIINIISDFIHYKAKIMHIWIVCILKASLPNTPDALLKVCLGTFMCLDPPGCKFDLFGIEASSLASSSSSGGVTMTECNGTAARPFLAFSSCNFLCVRHLMERK